MLIIYDESDLSTLSFMEYCTIKNYGFIPINIKSLTENNFSILDTGDRCIWYLEGNAIYLDQINGIYLRTTNFLDVFCEDYKKSDVDYVRKEWWSYFVYRMFKSKNCINHCTLELISYSIFETPFFLNIASELGFETPKYVFSASHEELKDIFYKDKKTKFIAQNTLIPSTDFRPSTKILESTIGLVEYVMGRPIFVHIIDDNIFSCMHYKSDRVSIELSSAEKEQCILLCKKSNLRAVQVILIEQENTGKKYLINLSPNPNWNLNHQDNIPLIFDCLYQALVGVVGI